MPPTLTRHLRLGFSGFTDRLRLTTLAFFHERLNGPIHMDAATLPWLAGFKNAILFLLNARLWSVTHPHDPPFSIFGPRPSIASSLYDSLEKYVNWHELFGLDSNSNIPLLEYFLKTSHRGSEYYVALVYDVLSPNDISVDWNNTPVEEPAELETLVNTLAEQLHKHPLIGTPLVYTSSARFELQIIQNQVILTGNMEGVDPNSIINREIRAKLFSLTNPFHCYNDAAFKAAQQTSVRAPLTVPLDVVISTLLTDLSNDISAGNAARRFVSTNTTLDLRGLNTWLSDMPARDLIRSTASLLRAKATHYECWRVFLLQDPGRIARSETALVTLFAIVQENFNIGVKIALSSVAILPPIFAPHFAEFHCVPSKKVFISIPPHYLMVDYDAKRADDRPIVDAYTHLTDSLLTLANDNNDDAIFIWNGGTMDELRERLLLLESSR